MYFIRRIDEILSILFTVGCLAILNSSHAQDQLSYQDIISLGASCTPDDTCVDFEDDIDSFSSTCDCDIYCVKYDTCCIDSAIFKSIKNYNQYIEKLSCLNIINYHSPIFGVSKCKRNWTGDTELKSLCEGENVVNFEDPVAMLPVTNRVTETIYKNYFCAVCNDENDQNLVFWEISIRGPDGMDHNTLEKRLVYDKTHGEWGFRIGGLSHMPLESVLIDFSPPQFFEDKLHECFPDLVSTCHPDWTDNEVKQKCLAYMGRVYAKVKDADYEATSQIMFRNVHCAICNFAEYTPESLCINPRNKWDNEGGNVTYGGAQGGGASYGGAAGQGFSSGGSGMSFPLILDINFKDGNDVGKINHCQLGEIDDPFSKKCRNISCRKPGYVVKNGKCAPS